MFANKLLAPFVFVSIICFYLAVEVDKSWTIGFIIPVIIAALIYIFAPQINWWWYQTHPLKADPLVKTLLNKNLPFYENLSPDEKDKFDHRMELFQLAVEFMPQGFEEVPKDVTSFIAANAIWLTFGREDFLFPKFETIVVYPHPFPSPQSDDKLVTSEIFEPDGAMVFSLEQFMPSFMELKKYYPSGLHEFAKVFVATHPELNYPNFGESLWESLPEMSGLSKNKIDNWFRLPGTPALPVAIVHFFVYTKEFKLKFPRESAMFDEIFYPKNV